MKHYPTQAELIALFHYDPETGVFIWKPHLSLTGNRMAGGGVVGTINSLGYRQIQIGKRVYLAHRLVWIIMTGGLPPAHIDHKNRDRGDNCWQNLRAATRQQNQYNRKSMNKIAKGVEKVRYGGYRVRIRVNGKRTHVGLFESVEDAKRGYAEAAAKYHGEFANVE